MAQLNPTTRNASAASCAYTNYWKHIFDGAPANTGSERVTVYEMRGLMGLGKRLLRF